MTKSKIKFDRKAPIMSMKSKIKRTGMALTKVGRVFKFKNKK